jgi:hypothetical protein
MIPTRAVIHAHFALQFSPKTKSPHASPLENPLPQRLYEQGQGPKPPLPVTSLGRHTRKCGICNHPDRDAIEQEFLRWYSPEDIARDYDIPDHSSVYRHAHATGLFDRRGTTIRVALEPLIEQATGVEVTADAVIRAVRTYAHLNNAGQWVNPPTHVVHHTLSIQPELPTAPKSARTRAISAPPLATDHSPLATDLQISNRQLQELEGDSSH